MGILHYVDPYTGRWTPISSAQTISYQWTYDSPTTMSDPGSGKVRTNTAVGTPSTVIAFDSLSLNSIDAYPTLMALQPDDLIYFQQSDNAANWGRYRVAGQPSVFTGYTLVPVELIEFQGSIAKNQTVLVQFTYLPGEGPGAGSSALFVMRGGDTMTGPLYLKADPTGLLEAATKQYADKMLPKTGGTVSGSTTFQSSVTVNGTLATDSAAGAKMEARSTTYMFRFWPEEVNNKVFMSAMKRADSTTIPLEFQASSYLFQYGAVSMPYGLATASLAVSQQAGTVFGTTGTTCELRFVTTSWGNKFRSAGSLGFYFYNDNLAQVPVHASQYYTNAVVFGAENEVPQSLMITPEPAPATRDGDPAVPADPEIDMTALMAVMYDALMSLPGGAAALSTATARMRKPQ